MRQIRHLPTILRVYKLYLPYPLFTYLFTKLVSTVVSIYSGLVTFNHATLHQATFDQ